MAEIVLAPGERFEHSHRLPSITVLRSGTATLEMDGTEIHLEANVAVSVNAEVAHALVNNGSTNACIDCTCVDGG